MTTDYTLLNKQFDALADGETDRLSLAANFVALLHSAMDDINWLGFYIRRGDELVLGPFQGQPACVHIPLGQGVCGTAAELMETQRIDDVHAFDGHIACDPVSKSELVVPLIWEGTVVAVLDIDSPSHARFSADDQAGVEKLVSTFVKAIDAHGQSLAEFI